MQVKVLFPRDIFTDFFWFKNKNLWDEFVPKNETQRPIKFDHNLQDWPFEVTIWYLQCHWCLLEFPTGTNTYDICHIFNKCANKLRTLLHHKQVWTDGIHCSLYSKLYLKLFLQTILRLLTSFHGTWNTNLITTTLVQLVVKAMTWINEWMNELKIVSYTSASFLMYFPSMLVFAFISWSWSLRWAIISFRCYLTKAKTYRLSGQNLYKRDPWVSIWRATLENGLSDSFETSRLCKTNNQKVTQGIFMDMSSILKRKGKW